MHEALVKRYSEEFVDMPDAEIEAMKEKENFDGSIEEYKEYLKAMKEAEIKGISLDANLASNAQVFIDNRPGSAMQPVAWVADKIRQASNSPSAGFGGQLVLKSFVPFTSIIGSIGEYMIDVAPGIGIARAYLANDGLGEKGTRMRDEQMSHEHTSVQCHLWVWLLWRQWRMKMTMMIRSLKLAVVVITIQTNTRETI